MHYCVVYLLHQHELSIKMLTNDMHATVCFVAKKSTKARGTPRFHIFFTNEAHFLVQNTTYMHHLSIHVYTLSICSPVLSFLNALVARTPILALRGRAHIT